MRHLIVILMLLASVCGLGAVEPATEAPSRFNDWLAGQAEHLRGGRPLAQAEGDRGQALAMARRPAMRALMASDPRRAAELAVPADLAAALPPGIRQHLERRVAGIGRLGVMCEMPPNHDHEDPNHDCSAVARIRRELLLEGQRYETYAFGAWDGAMTGDYQIAEALVLDGAALLGTSDPAPSAQAPVGEPPLPAPTNELSPRKSLLYIAKFADETVYPKTAAALVSEFTVTSNFFRENTADQMYLTALAGGTDGGTLMDIVYITLPSNAATYTSAFSTLLGNARTAASAQGFTYTNYNFDILVTSNKGNFSYAGIAWLGSQGTHLRSDYSSLRTAGHELGHNLGLSHAYFWRTDAPHPLGRDSRPGGYVGDADLDELIEYGHYFSMMSAQYSGEMDDATKPHFSPMEKAKLNWYTTGSASSSGVQTISSSGTYRIYRHDVKVPGGNPRGLRIENPATLYTGSTAYKYHLSYRYAPWSGATTQTRAGLLVEITTGAYPVQLDLTSFSNDDTSGGTWSDDNTDKKDGQLIIGRTYSDPGGAIHITPIGRNTTTAGAEYIDVVVNLGTFASNNAPVISAVTQTASQVAANAPVDFGVTASDPDGDTLIYGWTFDPLSGMIETGLNSSTATASWSTAGQYRATVTVTDGKGGRVSQTMIVTVGTPANTGMISGRVLWGGRPVADARVAIGATAQAWTNIDGYYVIPGLAAASHTLTCAKPDLTFTAKFTNPVSLTAGATALGCDWWANQPYPDPGSATTYAVSGTVTDAGGAMSGVVVTVGGRSTTSAANGSWSLSGIPAGTWPVTAWAPNASFNAASATVVSANVANIAVTRLRYSISGTVSAAAQGVSVTVRAGSYLVTGSTTRQGSNNTYSYSLSVPAGTYTVAASAANYQFAPGFTNPVNVSTGNSGNNNFSYTTPATRYQIRGAVTVNGIAVSAVSVTTTGASATTGPDGSYVLANLAAGTYTVTPSLSGGTFSPTSASVTLSTADATQNFTLSDAAPTVATAAAASPATVTSPTGSTTLTVLGADNGGEASLSYTWGATSGPYPVTFSANGSNAAKSSIATFQGPGTYVLRALIRDSRNQTVSSSVTVTVQAAVSNYLVTVSPYRSEMIFGDSRQYTATVWDSAGSVVSVTPTWSASGGTITGGGLYTATAAGSIFTITATANGAQGYAYAKVVGTGEPTATISASDAIASEPGLALGNGVFTVTRNIGLGAVTITYTVGGTATAGADYSTLAGTVAMADGQTTATITVAPLDDVAVEGHETVIVALATGTGYQVGGASSATVTIKDDEPCTVTIAASDNTASEPGIASGNGTYTLTRAGNPDAALTVGLTMGGLVSAGDYSGIGATATIAGGATTALLTLTPLDDAIAEVAETAILSVVTGTGYTPGASASATVTILDDEANQVSVVSSLASTPEASTNDAVLTFTRLGNRSAALAVTYSIGGTAVNGTDYASLSGAVSIGANSNTATVTINPTNDAIFEGPETAVVTVVAAAGYTVGSPNAATVTIDDNDLPTVSISASDALADEAGGTATFTITRAGPVYTGAMEVLYTVGGAAIAGADYQALAGSVVIPDGQPSAAIVLTPLQDAITEVPETVVVTIAANASVYAVATAPANAATATITDDTESPVLTIAAGDATASEPAKGDGTGTVIITRAGSPAASLTASLVVTGTATAGSDYTTLPATVALASGVTSATVTVTALDDATAEPDEAVVAALLGGTGYTLGTTTSATVNIYDDEATQIIAEASDSQAAEASSPNTGTFVLRRLGLRTGALTIAYTMSGTATNGSDYTTLSGSATLGANTASLNLTLTPINDASPEGTETAILTVGGGTGYSVGSPSSSTVEIADDEVVDVNITLQDGVCAEGGSPDPGSFRITRSTTSTSSLTVNLTVSGTAANGTDYTAIAGTATIPANATSVDVAVTPLNDAILEGSESVIITLALNGSAYDLGGNRTQTMWIRDDEVPTVTVAASDAAAAEPSDPGTFTLTASAAPAANLTVNYTMGGTAANGVDFTTLGGTATIPAGLTSVAVTVAPIDDILGEGAETAVLTLASGTGYNVGTTASATVTIAANDTPVASIAASDASASEPGTNKGTFTITLSNPASSNLTINLSVSGTATSGSDFSALAGSLAISAGGTAGTLTVSPLDDAAVEGSETVIATIASGTGYSIGTASATVSIADDDSASTQGLVVSTSALAVPEGGTASFTVQLQIAPAGDVAVAIAPTSGDADLTVSAGASLTFTVANWSVPQTVTLAAAQDADLANGSAVMSVTSAGLTTATVTASEADDDTQALVVSTATIAVAEGSTSAFTVRLAYQPAASVTVTTTRSAGDADLTVSGGGSLSFTTANWSSPQTVTLAAAEDADLVNGAATITVASTGLTSQAVAATETDNDTQAFVVSSAAVTVPEGSTASFTVRLAYQPAADTAVTVARTAGDTDISVTGGTALTFTSVNYATPQTVTLTAAEDADLAAGSTTITVSASGITATTVTATEADNDSLALVASVGALSVPEAGSQTFTLRLNAAPLSNVVVAVARTAGDSDLTVSAGGSLTFTTANWSTPQTVTVAAAADADTANGVATITGSASGVTSTSVTATEVDDDTQALTVSTSAVTVVEGSTATFTVRLAYQPTADTTVTVARTAGDADLAISGGTTLTFTSANYATPQTVTLAAAEDADASNGSAVITVSSAGLASQAVAASEGDNDTQALTTSTAAVTVAEGSTASFTVRLAYQPTVDTTVTVARTAGDTDIAVSGGTTLTFTSANYATPQTVTLAAAEDADVGNGSATITISSTGLASQAVAATETDNDAQALTLSTTTVTVPEGSTATFTVRLAYQPSADTAVAVARILGDGDLAVSGGATLTFTSANYATPQTVTLTAAEDADTANGEATFRLTSTGIVSQLVVATENDNDTQSLVVSSSAVSVPEGSTATLSVRLALPPTADTTVTVAPISGDADLTVASGATLTFTSVNYATPQTVTLAAAQDADVANGSAIIGVASTGLSTVLVTATEVDDDSQALALSTTTLAVPEGSTATFTIALAYQPSANTTVSVARSAGDGDIAVTSGTSLTFTAVNWSTPQTVTLAAAEDADTAAGVATITASSSGLASQTVTATETDNDTQALVLSASSATVPEGSTVTFTVRLNAQPAGDTTVTVVRTAGDSDLAVSGGGTLTFTTANWSTLQTVTLAAAEDADASNGTATVTVASTGLVSQTMTATESDNDTQSLVVSLSTVTVPEGSTATFTVRLNAQPGGDVAVSVTQASGDGDLAVSAGAALTFTTANWSTPQTVTLAAAEDADVANGTAGFTVASSGLSSQVVTATESDNDTQSLLLSAPSVTVPEGSTATFTVRLNAQPAGATTVLVARSSGDADITVSGGSALTFTTANWSTPQTVTLAAAEDADAANGSATITVSSSGLGSQTVTATEADNDTQSLLLSAASATVPEGSTASFTVRLTAQPAGNTTVSVARSSGDTDIAVSGGSVLTFTTANWSTPQTVTLAAAEDVDAANGSATITASSSGLGSQTVTATEADNDTQSLLLSANAVTVPEGATATFTVRLNAQPGADTVVTAARTSGDVDLAVSGGATLTFTTANWSTPQTVTLAAAEDADAANGTAVITIASSGLASQAVTVTEADNDTQSLVLSAAAVTVPEGATSGFTVRLNAQPAASTTVSVTRTAGDSSIAVTGGSTLIFTTANWATPQSVTLTAAEDSDTTAGSATITVASSGLSSQTVAASESDNDTQAFMVSAGVVTVPEGSSTSITVRLAYQPAASTAVSVAHSSGDADITVSGGSLLTFTTANWSTPQTVTLAAAEDVDAISGAAVITIAATGVADVTVTANEGDNDAQGVVVSAGSVVVVENGSASFTVRLNALPAGDTAVAVAWASGDADLTVSAGAALTFTTVNWSTPQTVTLTAAADDDAADGAAAFLITSAGLADVPLTASESDDDTLAMQASAASLAVPEAGSASFQVRLTAAPVAPLTLVVARTSGDTDLDVAAGSTLTFTAADWDTDQTVTLAAAADAGVTDGSAVFTIGGPGVADIEVVANEEDDDVQAFVLSTSTVSVPEGSSAGFSVALEHQPAADTTVSVMRSAGDGDVSVAVGGTLVFTTANWSAPQTVTVAAAADSDLADGVATISITASGIPDSTVSATEVDDDVLGLLVSSMTVGVPEGGTAAIQVRLNAAPAGTVTVGAAMTAGDADLSVVGGGTLTFDAGNWDTDQAIALAAAEDADDLHGTGVLTLSAAGLADATVAATEADNDGLAIVASLAAVDVPEGGTATFTVVLAAQPAVATTVSVGVGAGDADITVASGTTLVFTAADWSIPQTVTLAAAEDADTIVGTAQLTLGASGFPDLTVTATEVDNDSQSLVVSAVVAFVPEGSTTSVSIRLAAEPSAPTVVTVANTVGDADITVSGGGGALTFTSANWSTPQTVTLAAAEDADLVNGGATISVTSAGLTTIDITASEIDNDTQSLVVSPLSLNVPEGSSASFAVRLAAQPATDVSVAAVRTAGDADITVASGALLVFTPANWATAQQVLLAAAVDADFLVGNATINLTSAGLPAVSVSANEGEPPTVSNGGVIGRPGSGQGGCGAGALGGLLIAGFLASLRLRRRRG
jgi:hypothetical protein